MFRFPTSIAGCRICELSRETLIRMRHWALEALIANDPEFPVDADQLIRVRLA